MKEKLKNTKGITLIALIITIIILLILAMVSISLVMNENIIKHANNAVTAYNAAQTNELQQLNWVENQIKDYGGQTTTTTPIVPQLTAEEKEALNNTGHVTTDLGGITAYILSNLETDSILYRVIVMEGGSFWFADITADNTIVYIFTGEDTETIEMLNTEYGTRLEKNKWYSAPDSSNFELFTEYNGNFPLTKEILEKTEVYCQSYFERMFKK